MRTDTYQGEWRAIGVDEDGTESYIDDGAVVRDADTSFFTVWMRHVPPEGSPTYAELCAALGPACASRGEAPHHVRQLVEIDLAKDLSRTLRLVVCDEAGRVLDTIGFRRAEWTEIGTGIMATVRESVAKKFPEAAIAIGRSDSLRFSAPKVHVKPERIEMSKRYRVSESSSPSGTKLKLEEVL